MRAASLTAAGVHDAVINVMICGVMMPMVCTTSGIVSAIFCGIDTLKSV